MLPRRCGQCSASWFLLQATRCRPQQESPEDSSVQLGPSQIIPPLRSVHISRSAPVQAAVHHMTRAQGALAHHTDGRNATMQRPTRARCPAGHSYAVALCNCALEQGRVVDHARTGAERMSPAAGTARHCLLRGWRGVWAKTLQVERSTQSCGGEQGTAHGRARARERDARDKTRLII